MNNLNYKWILYLISSVILITLCIQVYWNYKNYEIGKQQLINDVQMSIDQAVDNYYTELAKNRTFEFIENRIDSSNSSKISDTLFQQKELKDIEHRFNVSTDTLKTKISIVNSSSFDSTTLKLKYLDANHRNWTESSVYKFIDNVSNPIKELSSKIIVSFTEDKFSLQKVDSLFEVELKRKDLNIDYGITLSGFFKKSDTLNPRSVKKAKLEATSTSPYFMNDSSITVHFSNVTLAIFKKTLAGILLSFVLVCSIIMSLLYLLKIIKKQKQLSEIKNDLISNITHEFKTPIATIGIAMEALQKFNGTIDPEKNERYTRIATEQVQKLNLMVEKLLETATLDSSNLELNFERHNLVDILQNSVNQWSVQTNNKQIICTASNDIIFYAVDSFHFENAINNLIDNAIKYGGDDISVSIKKEASSIYILISDSGRSLHTMHKKEIFEKFYRVPTGNEHNVKGFGIGLYYVKKIIEKHGGVIDLDVNRNTTFKIQLPND